jgi:general secretion pathway protein D
VHGFTVVETPESIKVLPDALAKENTPRFLEERGQGAGEEIVVHVLALANVPAEDVVELLRPMVPQNALLTHYPGSNLLVVADRASNIEHLLKLVRRIDHAGELDIQTITLAFADARAVAAVVNTLLPAREGGAKGGKGFSLAVDERSNSLLMSGDPVLREQLTAVIRGLDRPSGEGDATEVIFLDYASAAEMLPILKSVGASALISASSGETGCPKTARSRGAASFRARWSRPPRRGLARASRWVSTTAASCVRYCVRSREAAARMCSRRPPSSP